MNADTSLTGRDLNFYLATLPQQLFDKIDGLAFTAEPGVVKVDEHYKSPPQLYVSPATREQFAESYYGEDTDSGPGYTD